MATVDSGGNSPEWQEWVPLTSLTDQLPQQFQRGLATAPLQLTCIDAFKEHLLLGTNVGLVYLAHLPTCSLMRLKCENPVVPISCVAVVSTVDDMVAAGALDGTITIFQLPRVVPQENYAGNNNFGIREGFHVTQPTIKRFTVNSIHMASISSLTWSRNGMSLFSGDTQGLVAVVEINYQTSECHARDLLKEESSIVQLSYCNKKLAISTKERALVYTMEDGNICKVGQKPRKHPGIFGCTWSPSASKIGGEVLYTSRPGLRLWSANTKGEVSHTHIIKEVPHKSCIKLLHPSTEKAKEGQMFSFGTLYNLGMSHVVTFNPDWLFIIDISNLKVAGYSGSFSSITSVAVSEEAVFILEGSRQLHCLSLSPLAIGERKNVSTLPSQFGSPLTEKNLKQFGSRIINQSSGLLGHITKIGESVAAKVSEHASPSIVTGDQISSRSSSQHSNHSPMHQSTTGRQSSCQQNLDIRFQTTHELNLSDSHKPETGIFLPGSVAPKMMQSISSFLPGLLSSQGFTKPLPKGSADAFNVEGDQEVVEDLEEIVTVAQIVADETIDMGPLVTREKVKKKPKKKGGEGAMSDTVSICSSRSDISEGMSSSDCLTQVSSSDCLPHSPSTTDFMVMSSDTLSNIVRRDSLPQEQSQIIHYLDTNQNKEKLTVDNTCDNESFDCNVVCESLDEENEESVDEFSVFKNNNNNNEIDESQKPLVTVDTRTYEDFKTDIEQNEKFLAEVLDLSCLKMDHDTSLNLSEEVSIDNSDSERVGLVGFQRELSVESVGCSTPSTVKELSPLPESGSISGDFYAQFYHGVDTSLTSVDGEVNDIVGVRRFARMDSNDISEEGCERLNSNNSEGKVSSLLSYGPPSGSSMTSINSHDSSRKFTDSHDSRRYTNDNILTRHTDSDVAEICLSYLATDEPDYQEYNDTEEMTAGWIKHRIPSSLIRFAACESYIAFLDSYGYLYTKGYAKSSQSWKKLQISAQDISIPSAGTFMWMLIGSDAYALSWASDGDSASSPTKVLASKGVVSMCVDNDVAWYIKHNKKVYAQLNLTDNDPVGEEQSISCEDLLLEKLVCRDGVVWALTNTGHMAFRVGVSTVSPAGHGWGLMAAHPYKVKDIVLGPFNCGWMLDEHGGIFFRPGVCAENPQGKESRWWQVSSSSYLGNGLCCSLSVSQQGIWLADSGTQFIYTHSMDMAGHYWQISGEETWSLVCAEGLYQEHGAICALSPKGKLFLINPNTSSVVPVGLGNNECIVSVSQRPETLWVLTRTGELYIRMGLSATSIHGNTWEKLDLHQISDVHLCHISCGTEVVWGVDTRGGVYMRQGPLTPPPVDSLPPAWIQVDPSPLMGTAVFTKVYVGCKNHMVWALDSSQRIYVREAIFPELPIGISWVPVTGLKALHISISENEVYALSPSGEVYQRLGVAETNYIGDAWEKIPGKLAKISVSTDNNLWGLSNSGHLSYHQKILVCGENDLANRRTRDLSICSVNSVNGDWEVL